jgi:hypothetical protein
MAGDEGRLESDYSFVEGVVEFERDAFWKYTGIEAQN